MNCGNLNLLKTNDIYDDKLILLVKEFPELYDNSYENPKVRNKYWNRIGEKMRVDPDECRTRWRRIRDNYTKRYKTNRVENDVLNFLNPFIEKNNLNNTSVDESSNNNDIKIKDETDKIESNIVDELQTKFNNIVLNNESFKPEKSGVSSSTPYKHPLEDNKAEMTSFIGNVNFLVDEDDRGFLLLMYSEYKKLQNEKTISETRQKILQVIHNMRFGE